MRAALFQERLKPWEDFVHDELVELEREFVEVPYDVVSADSYAGGSFDLHVHLSIEGTDLCSVWECGDDPLGAAFVADFGLGKGGDDGDQLSVLVGVLEGAEHRKGMVSGRVAMKSCRLVGLQELEACEAVVWQPLGPREPLPSGFGVDLLAARPS